MKYAKGTGAVAAVFASGGPTRPETYEGRSRFFKAQDQFRTNIEPQDYGKTGKGGEMSKITGDKSETPIKPRT